MHPFQSGKSVVYPTKKDKLYFCTLMRAVFLLLFFLATTTHAQVVFRTEVLFDVVGVNTAFQVQYSLENAGDLAGMELQAEPPFTLIGGYADANRTSTQIFNGRATTTRTYTRTYNLRAGQTGTFKLPVAIARTAGGKTYLSNATTIEVVKETPQRNTAPDPFANTPDPFGGNPFGPGSPLDRIADAFTQEQRLPTAANLPRLAFLEIVPRKKTAYEGEPVIVDYLLVSGIPVSGNINKMPAPDGFWVEEISSEKEERGTRVVGNKVFQTLLIKRVAIIPQRTGSLTIEPAEMQAVGTIDDGYGNSQRHTWIIKSAPATLRIIPLPVAGKPKSFGGAVGNYKIEASLEPASMPRNGAAALRITLSGMGNLAQVDAPQPTLPKGLNAEPPVAKDALKSDGKSLTGSRTFTFPITATKEGHFTIPEIRFSFFNLQSERYEEIATRPLKLSVTEAEAVLVSNENEEEQSFWIAGIFAVVALVVGVLLGRRKKKEKVEGIPVPPVSAPEKTPLPDVAFAPQTAPETVVARTSREALSAIEKVLLLKTGQSFPTLSAPRLEALGMDVLTAQRVLLFRQKTEAALYGGLASSEEELWTEGRALLALIYNWKPIQNG